MNEKIEQFWRDATAEDVARLMRGEKVEARFKDGEESTCLLLAGYDASHLSGCFWIASNGSQWRQCQVYDPPEWFLNKPEPGEGYRLLEKFPHEPMQNGDDVHRDGCWHESAYAKLGDSPQCENLWYRRRIANNPVIPDSSNSSETPSSCRSSDTIPSGWRLLGKDEERLASDAYWSLGCKEWIVLGDDRVGVANREKLHAIRQVVSTLRIGYAYQFPDGKFMKITAKGFEVV